nr:vegetative cell wall protein gp1-like [Lolium perenne]
MSSTTELHCMPHPSQHLKLRQMPCQAAPKPQPRGRRPSLLAPGACRTEEQHDLPHPASHAPPPQPLAPPHPTRSTDAPAATSCPEIGRRAPRSPRRPHRSRPTRPKPSPDRSRHAAASSRAPGRRRSPAATTSAAAPSAASSSLSRQDMGRIPSPWFPHPASEPPPAGEETDPAAAGSTRALPGGDHR